MFFALWIVIFFHVSQHVSSVGVWSEWSAWSACNAYDAARHTRFRKCVLSDGKILSPTQCAGISKRTRQCESCSSPILKPRSKASVRDLNITSSGFRATEAAWCSTSQASGEYVEISFKNFVQLTAIGTRGHENGYVKKYKIKYSYDGRKWFTFYSNEDAEEFIANTDSSSLRQNNFKSRLVARYIRVYPTSSTTHACFKVELYGCEYNCGGLITRDAALVRPPTASKQIEELNCLWRIESELAKKLQVKFPYFRLFCKNGILELFDGNFPHTPENDENLVEAFCGHSGKVSSQMFEGGTIWMQYRSNATTDDIAFKLQINSFVTQTMNATSAKVAAPKTGFFNIYRYNWMITAPRNNDTILLTIHYFFSNNSRIVAAKCVGDAIIIHHSNQGETLFEKYCDIKHSKVFKSTNGFLKIKYKSKTDNPSWKLRFSYKILGYPSTTEHTTAHSKEDAIYTVYKRPARGTIKTPSNKVNDTSLEATQRKQATESSGKVPIIVSCVLAVLIAIVCVVALLHYLKRRQQYQRKHPYDCSNRPMSHFGEQDATPFINTNLLMWSDSRNSEKPKKSLPLVEVTLRENEPQRLSIIPPEMLKSGSAVSIGLPGNEGMGTLKVSDNFTEECMKLLNNNLSSSEGDNEEYNTKGNNEEYNPDEKIDLVPGKFKGVDRYGSLPEADRESPEVEDSLPEAEGHSPETDELLQSSK